MLGEIGENYTLVWGIDGARSVGGKQMPKAKIHLCPNKMYSNVLSITNGFGNDIKDLGNMKAFRCYVAMD